MLIKCIDDIALATVVNVKQKGWKKRGRKKLRKIGKTAGNIEVSVLRHKGRHSLRAKISWAKAFHKRIFDDMHDIFIIFSRLFLRTTSTRPWVFSFHNNTQQQYFLLLPQYWMGYLQNKWCFLKFLEAPNTHLAHELPGVWKWITGFFSIRVSFASSSSQALGRYFPHPWQRKPSLITPCMQHGPVHG